MGWITTVLAGLACTAATGAAIYYASFWLIRDHNNRAKITSFRRSLKNARSKLKYIHCEYQIIQTQLFKYGLEPLTKSGSSLLEKSFEREGGDDMSDDTASVNSASTASLSEKKILEYEELLTRLLERIDSVQPRTLWEEYAMNSLLPALNSKEFTQLQTMTSNLVASKKKLIFAIQGSLTILSTCNNQGSILLKSK